MQNSYFYSPFKALKTLLSSLRFCQPDLIVEPQRTDPLLVQKLDWFLVELLLKQKNVDMTISLRLIFLVNFFPNVSFIED